MLLILLLIIPLIGTILVSTNSGVNLGLATSGSTAQSIETNPKKIGLITSIINLFISIVVFLLFNFSSNQYQFVQEYHTINNIDFYLGVDGVSMYFVLLTTIIMPIAILSN